MARLASPAPARRRLALAIACAACTPGTRGGSPSGPASAGEAGPGVITVGSFDFPESVLLAYLYAGALSARGYPVRVLPDLGSRELVEPALMTGLVQLVTRVHRVGPGVRQPRPGPRHRQRRGHRRGAGEMDGGARHRHRPAGGGPGRERHRGDRRHGGPLPAARDLRPRPRGAGLVFGGPPECAERPDCLPGLRRAYGLRFRAFAALDAGGPLTRQALSRETSAGAALHHRSGHSGRSPGGTGRQPGPAAGRERHSGTPAGHRRPVRRRAARRAGCRVRAAVHGRPHGAGRPGRAGRPRPARGGRKLAAGTGAHPWASGAGTS